jgi:hypothetical protein
LVRDYVGMTYVVGSILGMQAVRQSSPSGNISLEKLPEVVLRPQRP